MSQKNPLAYTGLVSASTTVQGDAQFNPDEFTIVDGVVSLSGGGMAVDSLAGDTGTATPTGAGVITVAGGTNLTSVGSSHTLTMNMDAAISLATSVTSPIYTTSAADMNINAASTHDIIMKMGDAAAANKVLFKDSASVEVASVDSDGKATAVSYATSAAAANVTIAGSTVTAGGSDTDVTINLTPKGAGDVNISSGNLIIFGSAKHLNVQGGAVTDFIGQATLTNGTQTVNNTNISTEDRILVTRSAKNGSTAYGTFETTINNATSFVIRSAKSDTTTETGDASTVDYLIVRQI